jgi:hypothetical protein
MYQDGLALADQLCGDVVTALVHPPVSGVLHGSLLLADFRPGPGDVDLLIVVDDVLTPEEIDHLMAVASGCGHNADVRVITRKAAAIPPALRQRDGDEEAIDPGDLAMLLGRVRSEVAATLSRP